MLRSRLGLGGQGYGARDIVCRDFSLDTIRGENAARDLEVACFLLDILILVARELPGFFNI